MRVGYVQLVDYLFLENILQCDSFTFTIIFFFNKSNCLHTEDQTFHTDGLCMF
jgi:hypothetical protein